jgi:hypothetical protein
MDSAALDALSVFGDGIGPMDAIGIPVVQVAGTPVAAQIAPRQGSGRRAATRAASGAGWISVSIIELISISYLNNSTDHGLKP